jgi:hypothetical protein
MKNQPAIDLTKLFSGADPGTALDLRIVPNLVVVHLKCFEARRLAPYFLPDTQCIYGKTSSRCSHWLYGLTEVPHGDQNNNAFGEQCVFEDVNGDRLVEILCEIGKVKLPKYIDPKGEPVDYDLNGVPCEIELDSLITGLHYLAAATLLVRHYPQCGEGQKFAQILWGTLQSEWEDFDHYTPYSRYFVDKLLVGARDYETAHLIDTSAYSRHNIFHNYEMQNLGTMADIVGPMVCEKVEEWLGVSFE